MMRSLLLSSLLLVAGCTHTSPWSSTQGQKPLALDSGLGTRVSVRPVHVEEGFKVWRGGERLTLHDGLLIHLEGLDAGYFMPRAISSPMFVLDDTVGLLLVNPLLSHGQIILLAHSPDSGAQAVLWMTHAGVLPQKLVGARLAANAHRGQNIAVPSAATPRETYPTLEALRREVSPPVVIHQTRK